ncbi:hypothetical protein ES705_13113 [subsurface metagenome]
MINLQKTISKELTWVKLIIILTKDNICLE